MSFEPDGNAIVYCQGHFNTPTGKTAHGLVRFTRRYRVLSVVDRRWEGHDAGEVLDGKPNGIPLVASLEEALERARQGDLAPSHFVVGLAPDGGRLPLSARADVRKAVEARLHVDSGLHDFLSQDPQISSAARMAGVRIRDVRKPPPLKQLHFFSSKIEEVDCLKVALLGTDSAVGKRTTAWLLVQGLEAAGCPAQLVGTGQTAWMQGARYSIILDSLINDFVSGEIEHAVWSCWKETRPEVIVLEGQGSLVNPAYPGGFELLAAGRPDLVVLQHAPARQEYDGFPGYPLHPLEHQIRAIETVSGKPVAAVTINHENLSDEEIPGACARVTEETGLPAFDVLRDGADGLVRVVREFQANAGGPSRP